MRTNTRIKTRINKKHLKQIFQEYFGVVNSRVIRAIKSLCEQTLGFLLLAILHGTLLTTLACQQKNGADDEEVESTMGVTQGHVVGSFRSPTGSEIAESVAGVFSISENSLCTGVILDSQFVLTAAHCLGSRMVILFGNSLNNNSEYRRVIDYAVTPQWEAYKQELAPVGGDLLLLRFEGGLPQGYQRALLLQSLPLPKENDRTLIAGYGVSDPKKLKTQGKLRWGISTIAEIPYNDHEVKVRQNTESGACEGDSGGPAYIEYNGQNYVWAIVSRPNPSDDLSCKQFGVFTVLTYYSDWIREQMIRMASAKTQPPAEPPGNSSDAEASTPEPSPTPTPTPHPSPNPANPFE